VSRGTQAHWSRGTGRKLRVALFAIAALTSVVGAVAQPAIAGASTVPACDAMCAQARVHHPGSATTLVVHWKRYPYSSQADPGAIDRWGTTEPQCTGYATWALNAMGVHFGMRDRGANGRTVRFMSARGWAKSARQGGWTVSRTPVVGAIAQWRANESSHWTINHVRLGATAGSDGHVAIVTKVYANGTVRLAQYNAGEPTRSYSTMRAKAPRYLYIAVS
jgi:surface antigen